MENRYLTENGGIQTGESVKSSGSEVYVTRRAHNLSIVVMAIFTLICMLCAIYSSDAAIDTAEKRLSASISQSAAAKSEITDSSVPREDAAAETESRLMFKPMYVAREYDGGVGVFDFSDGALIRKIEVELSELPDADREALREGVELYSAGELYELADSLGG